MPCLKGVKVRPRKTAAITASILILACTSLGYWFLFVPPEFTWDPSSEHEILSVTELTEVDYNYIPPVRIWGDGRIVWAENERSSRRVSVGHLTEDQISDLFEQLAEAGFFTGFRIQRVFGGTGSGYKVVTVDLGGISFSKGLSFEQNRLSDLIAFIEAGAGADGEVFVPTVGYLHVVKIENSSCPDARVSHSWPVKESGFDLANLLGTESHGTEITGTVLEIAWEIAGKQCPVVESGGRAYWIGVTVPGITPFE